MKNDPKNAEKLIIEQRYKKFFLLLFGITAMKNAGISRDVKKERKNMEENNAQRSIRIRIVVTRSLLAFHRVCTFSSLFFSTKPCKHDAREEAFHTDACI